MAWDFDTCKRLDILKILSKFIAPVYNTIGSRVTTNEIIRKKATRDRVKPSKRVSKNCGIVVNPILRYFGTK